MVTIKYFITVAIAIFCAFRVHSQIVFSVEDECITDRRFDLKASVSKFNFSGLDYDLYAVLSGLETYESIDALANNINLAGDSVYLRFDKMPTGRFALDIFYEGDCFITDTFYYQPLDTARQPYTRPNLAYLPADNTFPCGDHRFTLDLTFDGRKRVFLSSASLYDNSRIVKEFDQYIDESNTTTRYWEVSKPLRELRSDNTYYNGGFTDGCVGINDQITIPCQAYANLPRPLLTTASDCSTADGQLRFLGGAISQCATGGESWLELRDKSGNLYPERENGGTKYVFYDDLPSQIYEMHVVGVEGCSSLVDTFDLRRYNVMDVYTEIQPACPNVANGSVYFDIYADGAVPTVTLDGRPLSLRSIGDDAYEVTAGGLSGGDYLLEVSAGACTMPYPVTVPVPAAGSGRDELTFGLFGRPKEVNICVGRSSNNVSLEVYNGTPPYTFEWLDGERQELSEHFGRHFNSGGLYTANVTDYCGLRGEVAVEVIDQRAQPPIAITYAPEPGGVCGNPRIQYAPGFDASAIRSVTVNGVTGVDLTVPYFPRGDSAALRFDYIRGGCADTTFVLELGQTFPTVTTVGTCQGQDNGRIEVKIARPPSIPTLSIGDIPEVPFTRRGDTIYAALEGLEAPKEYPYTLTYGNSCQVEHYAQVNRAPRDRAFVSYDDDDLACTFDLVCNGERLDGFEFEESPLSVPDYHGEKCRSFLTCGDVVIDEVRGRKRQVKVWFYEMLVEQAFAAGVIDQSYYTRAVNSTAGLGGCSTVGYCTATMQRGAIWSQRSDPTGTWRADGCHIGVCPDGMNRRQTYCNIDRYLPPGTVFDPDAYHALDCSYGQISLKQLAIWDADLRENFPDTYREAAAGEPQNLRDLAKEIAAAFGKQATHVDPDPHHITEHVNYTQDPLWCANVRFCRETFEVISYDHWDEVDCRRVYAKGPNTTSVATCKAPIQGSNMDLCPDSGYPSFVISACSPSNATASDHTWSNGPRIVAHSLCFETGPFAARPGPPPPGTVTSIPAYYVDSEFEFDVPVINRDLNIGSVDAYLPKLVNDFGSQMSFSEIPTGATEVDHLVVQDIEHLAEVITEDSDYFRLAMTAPLDDGTRRLGKDDGFSGVELPAGLNVEAITTDATLTSMIVDTDASLSLSADGVSQDLPTGRSLVTFDYSGNLSLNQIVPLPDPGFLVIDPDAYRPLPTYHELVGSVHATALLTHNRRTKSATLQRLSLDDAPLPLDYVVPETVDTILASPTLSSLLLGVNTDAGASTITILEPGKRTNGPLLTYEHSVDAGADLWNVSRVQGEVRMLAYGMSGLRYGGATETLVPTGLYRVSVSEDGLDAELVVDLGEVRLDDVSTSDAQVLSLAVNVPGNGFAQLNDHTLFNASPYGQSARHVAYLRDASPETRTTELQNARYLLYPSPARDYVTVKAFDGLDGASDMDAHLDYVVYAADGRRMLAGSTPPSEGLQRTFRLDVSVLPAGAYIVSVSRGGAAATAIKLVVVR